MKAKKIWVIDDDEGILDAMSMMLEINGYKVVPINDGKKALQTKDYPDLILLDIWMSGLDGRDVCHKLKKEPKTSRIPVIIVSASKEIEKLKNEAGADDYLEKPFNMDDLLAKVARYTKATANNQG